ncbi:hypothetical protein [Bythopirellula polymerisocia]|nr:hypothetical protein [Bythopirellula polymerisocia]
MPHCNATAAHNVITAIGDQTPFVHQFHSKCTNVGGEQNSCQDEFLQLQIVACERLYSSIDWRFCIEILGNERGNETMISLVDPERLA